MRSPKHMVAVKLSCIEPHLPKLNGFADIFLHLVTLILLLYFSSWFLLYGKSFELTASYPAAARKTDYY